MDTRPQVSPQLPPNPGPWRRFFAKWLDIMLFSFVLGVATSLVSPVVLHPLAMMLTQVFLWFFFAEPIFLSTWGSTPGNALLGIKVRDLNGQILTYDQAFKRSVKVWWRGYGAGIPIVNIICWIVAYNTLKREGVTSWDKSSYQVTLTPFNLAKKIVFVVLMVLFIILPVFIIDRAASKFMPWVSLKDKINQSLPRMLDAKTQLKAASVGDKSDIVRHDGKSTGLTYWVVAINSDAKDLTSPTLNQDFRTLVLPIACETFKMSGGSNPVIEEVDFSYNDKNFAFDKNKHIPITEVAFTPKDCAP